MQFENDESRVKKSKLWYHVWDWEVMRFWEQRVICPVVCYLTVISVEQALPGQSAQGAAGQQPGAGWAVQAKGGPLHRH